MQMSSNMISISTHVCLLGFSNVRKILVMRKANLIQNFAEYSSAYPSMSNPYDIKNKRFN